MQRTETLKAGAAELEGVLAPCGFAFVFGDEGNSSGGPFASGEFRSQDGVRRLEIHVRWSLGLVTYHVGNKHLSHRDYVRAVRAATGAVAEEASYPGFSGDTLEAFRDLREDLTRFGEVFLRGGDSDFVALQQWVEEHPEPKGFAALR